MKAIKCVYLWGKSLKIGLLDSPSSGRRTWCNGASSCLEREVTEITSKVPAEPL